uniref:Uncharacterized protein n=1 Tax=Glossina brevipalpis TaxID=37001 RepID=A0A1A9WZ59_9MUSC
MVALQEADKMKKKILKEKLNRKDFANVLLSITKSMHYLLTLLYYGFIMSRMLPNAFKLLTENIEELNNEHEMLRLLLHSLYYAIDKRLEENRSLCWRKWLYWQSPEMYQILEIINIANILAGINSLLNGSFIYLQICTTFHVSTLN